MIPRLLSLSAFLLALTGASVAQSGRTMVQTAPAALGTTYTYDVIHPSAAGGNYHEQFASAPTAAAINLGLPFVVGLLRVDIAGYFTLTSGFLSPTGTTSLGLPIPNNLELIGAMLDVQSIDVGFSPSLRIHLADNDLTPKVVPNVCDVAIFASPAASTTTGGNDIQDITPASIGAPVSRGFLAFSTQVIRHRGQEGFVEGYAGTFSATPHNSDIDSLSGRRVARRLINGAHQVVSMPNGYDVAIIRHTANPKRFSIMSFNRTTLASSIIAGTTVLDTSSTSIPASVLMPYPAFSSDGQWGVVIVNDTVGTSVPDRVLAFRTDGSQTVDITATTAPSTDYFDGSFYFTSDFIIGTGSGGWYYTSATAPTPMQSISLPNTTASNLPARWVFTFSHRVSRDGSTAYFATGSHATVSRQEMEVYKLVNNAGVPLVTNHTQFAVQTALAEFGYSAITPSGTNNSSVGIKAAVSPDNNRIAFLAGHPSVIATFPGLYVANGTANPALITVAGAAFYSEVNFLNNSTVTFFAGANSIAQDLYSYDTGTATTTRRTTANDYVTRGQFWSLNKNWWYFVRSNAASTRNDIVALNATTGALKDITGNEFDLGTLPALRTGSFNTTVDPWFALEYQLRRAPVGDFAYFTARRETGVGGVFEDSNVFGFDIENGGVATMLSSNLVQGATTAIRQIESLAISDDGTHLAWAERVNTVSTRSEDVMTMAATGGAVTQRSLSNATGQSVTDGSIHFNCGPPTGVVWSIGTGSTTVPTTNAKVEWAPLGAPATPVLLTPTPITSPPLLFHVLGSK